MGDPPRYRLREKAPALTKAQWCIVGIALVVGLVGLILGIVARSPLGTVLAGLGGTTLGLVLLLNQIATR